MPNITTNISVNNFPKCKRHVKITCNSRASPIQDLKTQLTFPWISPSVVQASGHTPNNKIQSVKQLTGK